MVQSVLQVLQWNPLGRTTSLHLLTSAPAKYLVDKTVSPFTIPVSCMRIDGFTDSFLRG